MKDYRYDDNERDNAMFDYADECLCGLIADERPGEDADEILGENGCTFLLARNKTGKYHDSVNRALVLDRLCAGAKYRESADVFSALNEEGMPYAVIKGAVLSEAAYGEPHFRCGRDIDLLIRRADTEHIREILNAKGFIQGRVSRAGEIQPYSREELLFHLAASHQTAPFIRRTDRAIPGIIKFDVNTDIMWGESAVKADMDFFLTNTVPSTLYGVPIRRLTPEAEFISLCLHHYKDMNSLYLLYIGKLKLSLFCDLYFYLKRVRPDPQRLQELCICLNVTDYVYCCVRHTAMLFPDPDLGVYVSQLDAVRSVRGLSLLITYGLADDEIHEWNIPLRHRLMISSMRDYLDKRITPGQRKKIEINMRLM